MGKRQHLMRLALGRSPFETDADIGFILPDAHISGRTGGANDKYVQQYNDKGRPVNAATESYNSDLRNAKNAVLELVGVVERKEQADQLHDLKHRYLRTQREALLRKEDECGEILDYAFAHITYLVKLWPEAVLKRMQVGYYDSTLSLTAILATELQMLFQGSLKLCLMNLFPSVANLIAHVCVQLPFTFVLEQAGGHLQMWAESRHFTRKTKIRLYTAVSWLFEGLLYVVDILLLPVEFHATAQCFGLAPPLQLFPSRAVYFQRLPNSFNSYGWQPVLRTTVLRHFTTPGFLMLANNIVSRDSNDDTTPVMAAFTNYRFPQINGTIDPEQDTATIEIPLLDRAIASILDKQYNLRRKILHWLGWTITIRPPSTHNITPVYEANTTTSRNTTNNQAQAHPVHRSTQLAHLPAKHLAQQTDDLLSRILLLPLQSLMLRTIAHSIIRTRSGSRRFYAPFGGSPIATVFRDPRSANAWTELATYTTRLGLGLAVVATVEIVVFFGVYGVTRYMGTRYFAWGCYGVVGKADPRHDMHRSSGSLGEEDDGHEEEEEEEEDDEEEGAIGSRQRSHASGS